MIEIGKIIRVFRKQKNYTLEELAEKSGVSKSYLSQIENDKVNMNISVLESVCNALDLPIYMCFLQERIKDIHVVKKDKRKKAIREDKAIEEFLTDNKFFDLHIHIIKLPEGHSPSELSVHKGEEFFYALKGVVQVDLSGYQQVELEEGDSISFSSMIPHSIHSPKGAEVLVASTTQPKNLE